MHVGRNLLSVILLCLLFLSLGYNGFYPSETTTFHEINLRKRLRRVPMNGKLMDMNDFKFIHNNEEICDSIRPRDILILTLVHSARENFASRKAIRDTWGSVREIGPHWKFRTVFLIGQPVPSTSALFPNSAEEMENKLEVEIQAHGDIVLGNFVDTYRNMTYKHLMGYKWVRHFCPEANTVIRADDDMFINIFKIKEFLQDNANETNSLFCLAMKNRAPERHVYDKWSVSRAEYGSDVYPDYCLGAAYITRPNLMHKLLDASEYFKYFWIDDVFVTGMLRMYPGIPSPPIGLTDISSRFTFFKSKKTEKEWKDQWMFVLVQRERVPSVLERLWIRTLTTGMSASNRSSTGEIVFRFT